jgi:hypothetical protein
MINYTLWTSALAAHSFSQWLRAVANMQLWPSMRGTRQQRKFWWTRLQGQPISIWTLVRQSTWYCRHYWPIVPAPDDRWWWLWSNWWNEDWQRKPKYSEKTCPSASLSTTNPTRIDQGSNPGSRGGKPATNRLSYGTACINMKVWKQMLYIICQFFFKVRYVTTLLASRL